MTDWAKAKARLEAELDLKATMSKYNGMDADIRAALQRESEQAEEIAALRKRVEELEREIEIAAKMGAEQHQRAEAAEKRVEELAKYDGGLTLEAQAELAAENREFRTIIAKRSAEVTRLREGALPDVVPEDVDALKAKLARVVDALEQILFLAEDAKQHTYTTCDVGDDTNADRGCSWCVARAALAAAKEE